MPNSLRLTFRRHKTICNNINWLDSYFLSFLSSKSETVNSKMAKMAYGFINDVTKCPPFLAKILDCMTFCHYLIHLFKISIGTVSYFPYFRRMTQSQFMKPH